VSESLPAFPIRVPSTLHQHVAWFEDPSRYPVRWDLVFSSRTLLTLVASIAGVGILYLAQRALRDEHWPRLPFLPLMAIGAPTLLAVQSAIPLIYSGVQPVLLAPHLHFGAPVGLLLGIVEILVGFSFITGILDRLAAIALALLVLLGFFLFQPLDVLAQFHWIGIALVVYAIGRQAVEADRPRRTPGWLPIVPAPETAVVGLRVLTGIAIMAPALREKIWNPGMAMAFLHDHPGFNFPHAFLGIGWMTDERFALAAGVFEFAIGVMLISGLLTRVVILAMWLPFNATVPFLPPQELLYHLPFFAIMYFLLVHGANLAPKSDGKGELRYVANRGGRVHLR